jgi:hypothetical protein
MNDPCFFSASRQGEFMSTIALLQLPKLPVHGSRLSLFELLGVPHSFAFCANVWDAGSWLTLAIFVRACLELVEGVGTSTPYREGSDFVKPKHPMSAASMSTRRKSRRVGQPSHYYSRRSKSKGGPAAPADPLTRKLGMACRGHGGCARGMLRGGVGLEKNWGTSRLSPDFLIGMARGTRRGTAELPRDAAQGT